MHAWLEQFDPFIVLAATAILLGGAAELGVRLGSRDGKEGRKLLVSSLLSAAALLLSLFLGFSFSMAEARFANRRGLVLEEANAIGTTYLRSEMLDEPHAQRAQALLREYVGVRLRALTPDTLEAAIRHSSALHRLLWEEAKASARLDPRSVPVGLFTMSLNELIDLHEKRLAIGLYARLPPPILVALYVLSCLTIVMLGYLAALAQARTPMPAVGVILCVAIALTLIIDLDRPWQSVFTVGRRALQDTQAMMTASH